MINKIFSKLNVWLDKSVEATAQGILKEVESFVAYAEKYNLTDKQWYLNWEDKLNELSVKDHSK